MAKQAMDSTGFENFLGFSFYIEQRRGKKRKFFFPQFDVTTYNFPLSISSMQDPSTSLSKQDSNSVLFTIVVV